MLKHSPSSPFLPFPVNGSIFEAACLFPTYPFSSSFAADSGILRAMKSRDFIPLHVVARPCRKGETAASEECSHGRTRRKEERDLQSGRRGRSNLDVNLGACLKFRAAAAALRPRPRSSGLGYVAARGFYRFIAIIRIFAFTAPFRRHFRLFMRPSLWPQCKSPSATGQ